MKMAPFPGLSAPWTGVDVRRLRAFAPSPVQTPRGRHAQLLTIAAARRLRCVERASLGRFEDAAYWKAVAPVAVFKAVELRTGGDFGALPA
ncbi:MAG TPA: hypothetical protein PLO65_03245 [Caulobacter sp.]|nr:hypothetical protein [Caulobacter sp.]